LNISDEILSATRMTEAEMRQEIAVMLFQKEKLTLAQASRFARMNRIAFQHLLASRQIPVHTMSKILNRILRTCGRWADCDYCQ
jgi:predicted HTH domain antitoxin